ncbi:hypothetical protein EJ05DRAFT_478039, partial [Pseudovirgaria hyperparasitica]
MSVPKQRLMDLLKVRTRIFSAVFNPTQVRQGTFVLRQRLRGPSVESYYPLKHASIKMMRKAYPGYEFPDEYEEKRVAKLEDRRSKGKGAPKKLKGQNMNKRKKKKK